ncbi:MAG: Asd/ArgC dimerization domain-containing protein [Acidobacteriota bacterium]
MAGRDARVAVGRRAHLALFDATTLTARGVKDHLVGRSFPTASVRLFSSTDDPGNNLTEFGGEAMLVTTPDIDALGALDIAFLCGTRREGERYLDWAERRGFVAIDLTTASNGRDDIPLVNAAVNPGSIPDRPRLIASPRPIAQFLSSLLAPAVRACGLVDATGVVFQPASGCGDPGIEELYQQTVGLLNFREVPKSVFRRQLAFNLIPGSLYGADEAPGGGDPSALDREVRKVTGGDYRLSVEVVLAPIFHCHVALLQLTLAPGTGLAELEAAFAASGELERCADGEGTTPIDRAGKPGIAVGGFRPARHPSSFWVWAVTDSMQSGAALNAVRIAEEILRRSGAEGTA